MFFKRISLVKYFKDEGESINEHEGSIENAAPSFWDMWPLKVEERCVYVFPYHVISSKGDEKFSYFLSQFSKLSKNVYLFLKGLIHCHM